MVKPPPIADHPAMIASKQAATVSRWVGARPACRGVFYRVWAPDHAEATVCIQASDATERPVSLARDAEGFFSGFDERGAAGDLYLLQLGQAGKFPDPASRFQPQGVHGPSECIDELSYVWQVDRWQRPGWQGQTIYEIHLGTFTPAGTFRSAIERLDHLAELGIGAIEIMPLADFAGSRNWGYDGVSLYAPARCYGRPDDLRALVDAAHQRGIAVILDVVYNHLGPSGNYLGQFAKDYFHASRATPWGGAINFDGENCQPVREFFLGNVAYWLDEYRIDGLRLDATHAIEDNSPRHLLSEISDLAHARGAFVIAEDERNSRKLLVPTEAGGLGLDALWSDDFHHQVRVALTGVRTAYFGSYPGTAEALARTVDCGWYYTGQAYPFWDGKSRGEACRDTPPTAFVYCIENHDQVGNRAFGERLEHVISPPVFRAASMLLCLSPYPPLLFMGQDWAASSPFLFFTDHEGELGRSVSEGRRREFAGLNQGVSVDQIPDPQEENSFLRSKLNWDELFVGGHRDTLYFYRECLLARRRWVQPIASDRANWSVTVVEPAVVLRYRAPGGPLALLVVSFQTGSIDSADTSEVFTLRPGCRWRVMLQTESPTFGGEGKIRGAAMSSEDFGAPWLDFQVPGAVLLLEEEI
jgi:malto-oligosyltrehalose trehalohydrolase